MPSDNRNNPPKPNKDQKVTDLPQQKSATSKDSQVKGGIKKSFQEVDP